MPCTSFRPTIEWRLVERIRSLHLDEGYDLHIADVVERLRNQFPEYGRKKYRPFFAMVQMAMRQIEKRIRIDSASIIIDGSTEREPVHVSNRTETIRKRSATRNGNQNEDVIVLDDVSHESAVEKGVIKKKFTGNRSNYLDRINLFGETVQEFTCKVPSVTLADVGGCHMQFLSVSQMLLQMKHPHIHEALGVSPPGGLLIHGPPGCGKTLFAHVIAGMLKMPLMEVASTELIGGVSGESEGRIRDLFSRALKFAPCIVLIDEIDAITPKRDNTSKEMERRIVSQLLSCLDNLIKTNTNQPCTSDADGIDDEKSGLRKKPADTKLVLVIGTTSRLESIDPALRRANRFDKEIALGIPDEAGRISILEIVCKGMKMDANVDIPHLARLTPGYVGADLKALAREASLNAVYRVFGSITNLSFNIEHASKEEVYREVQKRIDWLENGDSISLNELPEISVNASDFEKALKNIQPSAMREGFTTVPDVKWDDVGALNDIRDELMWSILHPIKHPEDFELLGIQSKPQGILLCGPPGCGKTLLAKAIANETGMNFISVKGPELICMYVGESERAVRTVFQRARDSSPCVIFFDEIDALCPKRSSSETTGSARLVNQMLTEMDGMCCRKQIFLIGATNRPDIVDRAILRPGRLDKILFVDFPSCSDRSDILRKITKNGLHPRIGSDVNFDELAENSLLNWFTGADLAALVHEAGINALKDRLKEGNVDAVEKRHFLKAIESVKPSVSEGDRVNYERIKQRYAKKLS